MHNAEVNALSREVFVTERVQLYFDENVDQRLIASLRKQGIDIKILEEQNLKGEQDDILHLIRATELGRVLVTSDRDFEAIHKEICELWLSNPEIHHNGIILLVHRKPALGVGATAKKLAEMVEQTRPTEFLNILRYL